MEVKRIPGFSRYSVSDTGIVYCADGRMKKTTHDACGYLRTCIKGDSGRSSNVAVHRAVAGAFLGLDIANRGLVVCHKNDIRDDNRVENLFVGTIADNNKDMYRKGRSNFFGKKNKTQERWVNKLTDKDIYEIKLRLIGGELGCDIAKVFGVTNSTITKIRKGETGHWVYVEGEETLNIRKRGTLDKDECLRLYKLGIDTVDISRKLGVTRKRVLVFLKKNCEEYKGFEPKLNKQNLFSIKEMILRGDSDNSIAKCFSVARTTISRIRNGKIYKFLGFAETDKTKSDEKRDVVQARIRRLRGKNEQRIVALHKKGYTNKEISKILGISGNSTQRIGRVLRKNVDGYEPVGGRKLNKKSVIKIREMLEFGKTCGEIAIEYGVSIETIRGISCGRIWASVK